MPRKSKATLAAEAATQEGAPVPARRGRPPRASKAPPMPAEAENGSAPSVAADAEAASGPEATGETPTERPAAAEAEAEPAAPSKPAAQWDAAADTVQFDWPEIEQTASRPGPNQVMAKLLIAARAEGANSRWPFQAA